jgi:hypothetical protein
VAARNQSTRPAMHATGFNHNPTLRMCAAGLTPSPLVNDRYYGHGIHGRTRKSPWKLLFISVFFSGFRGYEYIPVPGPTHQHPFLSN